VKFIEDRKGTHWAVSEIISISGLPKTTNDNDPVAENYHRATVRNGDTIYIHYQDVEKLQRAPATAFAATPGTFIVRINDTAPEQYWKEEVAGWMIGDDGTVYPVTPDGVNDGTDENLTILMPSGSVVDTQNRSFPSLQEWLDAVGEDGAAD